MQTKVYENRAYVFTKSKKVHFAYYTMHKIIQFVWQNYYTTIFGICKHFLQKKENGIPLSRYAVVFIKPFIILRSMRRSRRLR